MADGEEEQIRQEFKSLIDEAQAEADQAPALAQRDLKRHSPVAASSLVEGVVEGACASATVTIPDFKR